ncbi:hypothetical protein BD770DRAFT_68447 [Pilaira anomala]|nr:hypothetical protein BD770DRAFT_68447 [Pilaira anomala]
MSSALFSLSSEIIWRVIQLLEPIDLSSTRQVSKRLRTYCDHPQNWKSISLIAPPTSSSSSSNTMKDEKRINLWNLTQLRHIIQPHLQFIQTICIWGVRDSIIRYLCQHCHHLQTLTIFGWSTLSNHAFSVQPSNHSLLLLRSIRLVGRQRDRRSKNFISFDSTATFFEDLIRKWPQLEEISMINCQVQIQIDPLLKLFGYVYVYQSDSHFLNSFMVVASKRACSSEHIKNIFRLYFSSSSSSHHLDVVMSDASPSSRTIDLDHPIENYEMPTTTTTTTSWIEKNVWCPIKKEKQRELIQFGVYFLHTINNDMNN